MTRRVLALAAVAAALLAGCGGEPTPEPRLIVFARAPATNVFSDLYLLQTDGSLRRLTHGGIDSDPVWSSDGRRLAFQRINEGTAARALRRERGRQRRPRAARQRLGQHRLVARRPPAAVRRRRPRLRHERGLDRRAPAASTRRRAEPRTPAGRRTGSRSSFALGGDTSGDVWVMNSDGRGRRRLTRLRARAGLPRLPDLVARRPADRATCCRAASHVVDADGSDHRVLTRFPEGIFPSTPAWSPDSRPIAFARLKLGRDRRKSGLYVADADSGAVQRLTHDIDSSPSWSPNGHQIVFQRLTGFHISEITLMNRDGSNVVRPHRPEAGRTRRPRGGRPAAERLGRSGSSGRP